MEPNMLLRLATGCQSMTLGLEFMMLPGNQRLVVLGTRRTVQMDALIRHHL